MVEKIAHALECEGYEVFWDRDLEGGSKWIDALDRKLRTVDAVVVVWSADSVESEYVQAEAEAGLERKILVPVIVEECLIPHPFDEVNAIDLSAWQGGRGYGRFRKFISAIEKNFELEDDLDTVGEMFDELETLFDEDAMDELLEGAKAGDPEDQLSLGIAYQNGVGGLNENPSKALRWMTRAAEQGHEPAFCNLGWLYYGGYLGEMDIPNALKWFKRAADTGDANAAWQVSQIYADGEGGIRKNLKLARRYCKLAADLGSEEATEMLDSL